MMTLERQQGILSKMEKKGKQDKMFLGAEDIPEEQGIS